jgi:hypothetical protein
VLWRVLVAATLAHEVARLNIVGLPRAAHSEGHGLAAILLGSIVQQHILRRNSQSECFARQWMHRSSECCNDCLGVSFTGLPGAGHAKGHRLAAMLLGSIAQQHFLHSDHDL